MSTAGRHASAWPAKPSEGRSYGTDTSQREPTRNTPATPSVDPVETSDPAYGLGRPGRLRQWQDRDVTNPRTPLASLSDDDLAGFLAEQRQAYAALQVARPQARPDAGQAVRRAARPRRTTCSHLPTTTRDRAGVDVRNYGGLEGLAELREIFAELLWVEPAQVVAGGNSSLTMMYGTHRRLPPLRRRRLPAALEPGGEGHASSARSPATTATSRCSASFGIEMVTVDDARRRPGRRRRRGARQGRPERQGHLGRPDLRQPVRRRRARRRSPRASPPMPTAAPDFTIFWDNAYAFHHLTEEEAKSADILSLAAASGHPNRPIMFASTSKITFAGAGVAVLAAPARQRDVVPQAPRHGLDRSRQGQPPAARRVLPRRRRRAGAHAPAPRDHRAEVRRGRRGPDARRSTGLGVAEWTHPTGGYFVNLDVLDGTASRVVALAKEAGIALTPAGASFPSGNDPRDRNIRLAPTFPVLDEVRTAMAGVATCVALAAAEKLTQDRAAGVGAEGDGATPSAGTPRAATHTATEGASR